MIKRIKIAYSCLILFFLSLIAFQHYQAYEKSLLKYKEYLPIYKSFTLYNKDYQHLSILQRIQIKLTILQQIKTLNKKGWHKSVIKHVYLRHLQLSYSSGKINNKGLDQQLQESQKIGSPLFNQLWKTQVTSSQPKEALEFFLSLLAFPNEFSGQKQETNLLLAHFDPQLRPTDAFWENLSHLVKITFPENQLAEETPLAKKIHQLRYLISLQQVIWVRQHFKHDKDDDAHALARYLLTLNDQDYHLDEPARYHNKVASYSNEEGKQYPVYPNPKKTINFKILVHFHSEFILSQAGQFLTAYDPLTAQKDAIVNSASFNYATQNDETHEHLDITPIDSNDPMRIKQVITNGEHPYQTATLKQQKSTTDPIFSQHKKSLRTLIKEVRQKFIDTMVQLKQH